MALRQLRQCLAGARWFHSTHDPISRVSSLVPIVIESTPKGERAWDIFSRLLRERIVYVNGSIHQNSADLIVAQLLFLESEDPDKPVRRGVVRASHHTPTLAD